MDLLLQRMADSRSVMGSPRQKCCLRSELLSPATCMKKKETELDNIDDNIRTTPQLITNDTKLETDNKPSNSNFKPCTNSIKGASTNFAQTNKKINPIFGELFQSSDDDESDNDSEFAIDDKTIDNIELNSNDNNIHEDTYNSKFEEITSAFGGKFSEIELDDNGNDIGTKNVTPSAATPIPTPFTMQNDITSPKNRANSSSSSLSPFRNNNGCSDGNSLHRRRKSSVSATGMLSSNRHQTKRLVNQFLQSSKDFNCSEQLLKDCYEIDIENNINHGKTNLTGMVSFNENSNKTKNSITENNNIPTNIDNINKKPDDHSKLPIINLNQITLQDLLHKDLDISRDGTPGSIITHTTDSTQTAVGSYNSSLVSLLRSISPTPVSTVIPTPTSALSTALPILTPLEQRNTSQPLSALSTSLSLSSAMDNQLRMFSELQDNNLSGRTYGTVDFSSDKNSTEVSNFSSYRNHIENTLNTVEQTIKSDLHNYLIKDEIELSSNIQQFDKLKDDLRATKEGLIGIQKLITDEYINELNSQFDENDSNSFIYQLSSDVMGSVIKLEELEQRMDQYKNILTRQKQMIRTLEELSELKNSLNETRMKTKYVYQYRFIVIDLFIVSCLIYCLMFLKHVVM